MEIPAETGRSMSSADLRRQWANRRAQGAGRTPSRDDTLALICGAMRERWQIDVTLHEEAIYFEALDFDTCVIRLSGGTRIERRMPDVDETVAARALGMNPTLCRGHFVFGITGAVLVLHRYVMPSESFETCLEAIRDFVVVSDRLKRAVTGP